MAAFLISHTNYSLDSLKYDFNFNDVGGEIVAKGFEKLRNKEKKTNPVLLRKIKIFKKYNHELIESVLDALIKSNIKPHQMDEEGKIVEYTDPQVIEGELGLMGVMMLGSHLYNAQIAKNQTKAKVLEFLIAYSDKLKRGIIILYLRENYRAK